MELLDRKTYYRAFGTEMPGSTAAFWLTSTGIYCRPICPARTAEFVNCRFFASAAAAQEAGFRPACVAAPRSRPTSLFGAARRTRCARALALIAEGALDGAGADVETLAERLGVGGRQLRRLFRRHFRASPIAVAQTRRVLFAKELAHETHLPMIEVAMAAGFGSVRRFNETFHELFGRPPSALRRKSRRAGRRSAAGGVTLAPADRPPYDWPGMLAPLASPCRFRRETIEDDCGTAGSNSTAAAAASRSPICRNRHPLPVNIRFPSVQALPGDRCANPPRLRSRRRYRHHRQPPRPRSHARTPGRKAARPARARRLGARDHAGVQGDAVSALDTVPAWRPWHAYAAQHLRKANMSPPH